MSDDTIRVNFAPPKFTVRRFPMPRKAGPVVFDMPAGSQLVGVDAPTHDPAVILFFWALPLEERPKIRSKFIVVAEDEPFAVEECSGLVQMDDGQVYEEVHTHLDAVGFWTEAGEDGSFRTFHILEIVDDDPVVEDEDDEDPAEDTDHTDSP